MLQPKLGITLQHELLNGVGNIRSSIDMSWLLKFNQEPDKESRIDLPNQGLQRMDGTRGLSCLLY
jgi:hypothetical protein